MSMQHCKLHAVSVETGRTSSSLLMDVKMHRHHGLKIILKEHSYFHAPCDQNAMRRGPSFSKDINQLLKPRSFKFLSCKNYNATFTVYILFYQLQNSSRPFHWLKEVQVVNIYLYQRTLVSHCYGENFDGLYLLNLQK